MWNAKTTFFVSSEEYKQLQKKYGQEPKAIRVQKTVLGKVKTLIEFQIKS